MAPELKQHKFNLKTNLIIFEFVQKLLTFSRALFQGLGLPLSLFGFAIDYTFINMFWEIEKLKLVTKTQIDR